MSKKQEGTVKADWQNAGKHASWLLREKNLVSPSLSGPAVSTPKVRKPKDQPKDDDAEESGSPGKDLMES